MKDHAIIETIMVYFRDYSIDSGRTILADLGRRWAGSAETSSSLLIQTFEDRLVAFEIVHRISRLRDLQVRVKIYPGMELNKLLLKYPTKSASFRLTTSQISLHS